MKLSEEVCIQTVTMLFRRNDEYTLEKLMREHCTCFCSRTASPEFSPKNHATGCPYRNMMESCTERYLQQKGAAIQGSKGRNRNSLFLP